MVSALQVGAPACLLGQKIGFSLCTHDQGVLPSIIFGAVPFLLVEDLSVEITCLCRLLIYTDNDLYLILGFNSSLQIIVSP